MRPVFAVNQQLKSSGYVRRYYGLVSQSLSISSSEKKRSATCKAAADVEMMDDSGPKQPKRVTREELYELVWQTPMVRLARQFGLSDNGLAKICDRLKVP